MFDKLHEKLQKKNESLRATCELLELLYTLLEQRGDEYALDLLRKEVEKDESAEY